VIIRVKSLPRRFFTGKNPPGGEFLPVKCRRGATFQGGDTVIVDGKCCSSVEMQQPLNKSSLTSRSIQAPIVVLAACGCSRQSSIAVI